MKDFPTRGWTGPKTARQPGVVQQRGEWMQKSEFDFEEWRLLIGSSIISFGEIELMTYACLTHLPADNIFEIVADLPFSKRIELIINILEEKTIPKEIKEDFKDLLTKAKKAAETRNLIAHNPVQIAVYKHEPTGEILLRPEIAAIRKKKKVFRLGDLRTFAAEVEELAVTTRTVMGQIFAACDRGERGSC